MTKPEKTRKQIVGENIRNYLKLNHMNQKDAARAAGLNPSTVSNWVNEKCAARDTLLIKLAAVFRVSLSSLTEDQSRTALRQNYYMSAWQRSVNDRCEKDPVFREYVDIGLQADLPERLLAYVSMLKNLTEESGKTKN